MKTIMVVTGSMLMAVSGFADTFPNMSSMYAAAITAPAPTTAVAPTMYMMPTTPPPPTTAAPDPSLLMMMPPILMSDAEKAAINAEAAADETEADAAIADSNLPDDTSVTDDPTTTMAGRAPSAAVVAARRAVKAAEKVLLQRTLAFNKLETVLMKMQAEKAEWDKKKAECLKNGDGDGYAVCDAACRLADRVIPRVTTERVTAMHKMWDARDALDAAKKTLADAEMKDMMNNMPH